MKHYKKAIISYLKYLKIKGNIMRMTNSDSITCKISYLS